jgi:CBS domain-containing protein
MIAADVMSGPVHIVTPDDQVSHARNLMVKHHISRLPVVSEEDLVGIITKKDIGYRLLEKDPLWRRRPIDTIHVQILMTPRPIYITPDTGVREIARFMVELDISGIPILESGKIIGIVTKSDIIKSGLLEGLSARVSDLMEDAATVSRYHSVSHVIELMSERNDKVLVTNNDGTLAGIITESNLAFYTYANAGAGLPEHDISMLRKRDAGGRKMFRHVFHASAIAEDVMTRPVITVDPAASIAEALGLFRSYHINSVVAVRETEICGILKRDDIIREVTT